MGLLATLKVMLGVDSVDFQQKMRSSSEQVGLFESNFGKRTSMVERHGLRLANTADAIASSMRRMQVDGVGALGQLAEAAGFVKLGITLALIKTGVDTVQASLKLISRDWMDANKPVVEMADALVKDKVGMENLVHEIDFFAKRLGTSAEALGVTTTATRENAVGLLYLKESLEKEAKAQRDATIGRAEFLEGTKIAAAKTAEETRLHEESVAWLRASREAQAHFNLVHGQGVPIVFQMAAALAAGAAKQREYLEEARKQAGVWNEADLRAKAEALEEMVVAIAQSGGSATQTVAKLGSQFEEVTKVAAELGVALSPEFERAAEAITKGPGDAMDDLFASFRGLPREVEASRSASAAALDKMGKDLEGSIAGGFGTGIEQGVSYGEQQVAAWRERLESTPIKLRFDASDLQRIIDAVTSGRMPTTTGSAP